ncbi:hypothetical protein B296_00039122 [Ensete ventricosum]|uniref:Protein kinase domain-containing protein n=1 Tax=Ensete ventricosum TaxID=4639 RepID=A0A426Y664_ENSVE|nr:hypothetical protein B296_00039122 [Ensete ventricosum]
MHRYYVSQQLTEKSDIYSFGVILLELISGQEPISSESFGLNCRNIVAWDDYDLQSVWKIAEIAIMCVKPHGAQRPSISEVLKEVQQAIAIQHGSELNGNCLIERLSKESVGTSMHVDHPLNLPTYQNASFPELFVQPDLR